VSVSGRSAGQSRDASRLTAVARDMESGPDMTAGSGRNSPAARPQSNSG